MWMNTIKYGSYTMSGSGSEGSCSDNSADISHIIGSDQSDSCTINCDSNDCGQKTLDTVTWSNRS